MKKPLIALSLLALVAGLIATTIDFNNTSDLTTYFNGSPGHVYTNAGSGGLSNSGCVTILPNTFEVWTGKTGMALPTVGQTLTASVYFYNELNSGYDGIGYSTASMNKGTSNNGGNLSTVGAHWLGMSLHGGGDYIYNDAVAAGTYSEGFDIPLHAWYKIFFMLTYLGSNQFSGTLEIWPSNSIGDVTSPSPLKAHTVASMTNAGLATAGVMYPYFINDGQRCIKMDELSFHYGAGTETFNVEVTSTPSGAIISGGAESPIPTPHTFSMEEGTGATYTVSLTDYLWVLDPLFDSNVITNIGGNKHVNFIGTYDHVGTGGFEYIGEPGAGLTGVETTIGALEPTYPLPPNIGVSGTPIVMMFTGTITTDLTVIVPVGTWYVIAYYSGAWQQASPYPCTNPATALFTDVPFGGKADIPVIITPGDTTLPVELSSFTATPAADLNSVTLNWTVESETNHMGYDVMRSYDNALNHAQKVNSSIITTGTQNGTQTNYQYNDSDLESGSTYYYWLASISLDGMVDFYGPISVNLTIPPDGNGTPLIPNVTSLQRAFPNPFNPTVTIAYGLAKSEHIQILIYNNKGQKIRTLLDDTKSPGSSRLIWDGTTDTGNSLPSGVYYVKMTAGKYSSSQKIVLLK